MKKMSRTVLYSAAVVTLGLGAVISIYSSGQQNSTLLPELALIEPAAGDIGMVDVNAPAEASSAAALDSDASIAAETEALADAVKAEAIALEAIAEDAAAETIEAAQDVSESSDQLTAEAAATAAEAAVTADEILSELEAIFDAQDLNAIVPAAGEHDHSGDEQLQDTTK